MTEPAAMANCGIHRGVASLPVDTSLKAVRLPGQAAAVKGEQAAQHRGK